MEFQNDDHSQLRRKNSSRNRIDHKFVSYRHLYVMELLISEPKASDFPTNVETLGIFLSNYNKKISLLASNLDGAVKKHW